MESVVIVCQRPTYDYIFSISEYITYEIII